MKAIFFDAAGTLFELTETVGQHYATVANRIGLRWDATALDGAFVQHWKQMRPPPATGRPRDDDDKGWWRELADRVIEEIAPATQELDRDNFFEIAYEHFAEAGVWRVYPEVVEVLEYLQPQFHLAIVSNFDGRLRMILEHLGLSKFFRHVFISSELGADKPNPLIYRRALEIAGISAGEALHAGDDPERDWKGAADAGLAVLKLDRPKNSLRDLLTDARLAGTGGLRGQSN